MSQRYDDLDAMLAAAVAQLPTPSIEDLMRTHLEAESMPPTVTTLPMPDFPRFGVARYRCPLCPWYHDETPGAETPGPLLLPLSLSPQNISGALTSRAKVSANAHVRRVENAIADHFRVTHPDR